MDTMHLMLKYINRYEMDKLTLEELIKQRDEMIERNLKIAREKETLRNSNTINGFAERLPKSCLRKNHGCYTSPFSPEEKSVFTSDSFIITNGHGGINGRIF